MFLRIYFLLFPYICKHKMQCVCSSTCRKTLSKNLKWLLVKLTLFASLCFSIIPIQVHSKPQNVKCCNSVLLQVPSSKFDVLRENHLNLICRTISGSLKILVIFQLVHHKLILLAFQKRQITFFEFQVKGIVYLTKQTSLMRK